MKYNIFALETFRFKNIPDVFCSSVFHFILALPLLFLIELNTYLIFFLWLRKYLIVFFS